MNQDDIYNLLLILLLMSNERENGDNAPCPPGRENTAATNVCGRRSTDNTTF